MVKGTFVTVALMGLGLGLVAFEWPPQDGAKQAPADPKAIDTTRFVAKGMVTNKLEKDVVIDAPPAKVFAAFTSSDGWKRFLGTSSHIELRIGGPFELYFGGDTVPEGLRGSEGCQILSYLPDRMLSFSWSAPPDSPAERAQRSWVVVFFEPAPGDKTRLQLTHTGFGDGGKWPAIMGHFDQAWTRVLGALVASFKK